MYKLLFIALLVSLCATPAPAQSTSTESNDWTGFYVGGNGFASSDKSDAEATLRINQISNLRVTGRGIVVIPATTRDFAASRRETNWNGGFQAGYQWQVGRFVFGPEADFNPFHRTVSVSQSQQLPPTVLTPNTSFEARRDVRLSREFSIRARAGAAFGRTLIYGTVGYTGARVQVSSIDTFINPGGLTAPCPPGSSPSCAQFNLGPSGPVVNTASERQNMGGWTGGFGVERRLGARFSLGFEYRHSDLRSETFTPGNPMRVNTGPLPRGTDGLPSDPIAPVIGGVEPSPTRVSLNSDSFRVRVNFHF